MGEPARSDQPIRPQLGLFDAISIIIGIVIGASIYKAPPLIFGNVSDPLTGLGVWAGCGLLALIGALCYAELASTYPKAGGDFVYLTRAFGPWLGFLFAWAQLVVIVAGSVGAMAFVFGEYTTGLFALGGDKTADEVWAASFAVLAVVGLTAMNILGVELGKWTQNLLTILKIVGLGAIIYVGFSYGNSENLLTPPPADRGYFFQGLAFVLVMYAYGGWNDAAFVAADLKQSRSIVLALILGTTGIMVVYLLVNAAYVMALGFDGVRSFENPVAAATLAKLGVAGAKGMSLLVMVSALGAINGLIFTYSRVFFSMGAEYNLFAILGKWNRSLGSPVWTLLLQGLFSVILIVLVGTEFGRQQIDRLLLPLGWDSKNWEQYHGGFDTLVAATAPVFWSFFLMTGLAFFALRERDAQVTRPFRVPFHPLLPLIFCGTCIFMLYSALAYVKMLALIGAVPVAVGLPLFWLSRRTRPAWEETPASPAVFQATPRPAGLEESPRPASEPPAGEAATETHVAPAPTADGDEDKVTENPFRTLGPQ